MTLCVRESHIACMIFPLYVLVRLDTRQFEIYTTIMSLGASTRSLNVFALVVTGHGILNDSSDELNGPYRNISCTFYFSSKVQTIYQIDNEYIYSQLRWTKILACDKPNLVSITYTWGSRL